MAMKKRLVSKGTHVRPKTSDFKLNPWALRFQNRQTRREMQALRRLRLSQSAQQRAEAWKDFCAAILLGYDTPDNREMLEAVTYKRVTDRWATQYCFCVKGTGWQVADVLSWAAGGGSWRATARHFPGMSRHQYEQVLCFAVRLARVYGCAEVKMR